MENSGLRGGTRDSHKKARGFNRLGQIRRGTDGRKQVGDVLVVVELGNGKLEGKPERKKGRKKVEPVG